MGLAGALEKCTGHNSISKLRQINQAQIDQCTKMIRLGSKQFTVSVHGAFNIPPGIARESEFEQQFTVIAWRSCGRLEQAYCGGNVAGRSQQARKRAGCARRIGIQRARRFETVPRIFEITGFQCTVALPEESVDGIRHLSEHAGIPRRRGSEITRGEQCVGPRQRLIALATHRSARDTGCIAWRSPQTLPRWSTRCIAANSLRHSSPYSQSRNSSK